MGGLAKLDAGRMFDQVIWSPATAAHCLWVGSGAGGHPLVLGGLVVRGGAKVAA